MVALHFNAIDFVLSSMKELNLISEIIQITKRTAIRKSRVFVPLHFWDSMDVR